MISRERQGNQGFAAIGDDERGAKRLQPSRDFESLLLIFDGNEPGNALYRCSLPQ